jgi:hypothetical protein
MVSRGVDGIAQRETTYVFDFLQCPGGVAKEESED